MTSTPVLFNPPMDYEKVNEALEEVCNEVTMTDDEKDYAKGLIESQYCGTSKLFSIDIDIVKDRIRLARLMDSSDENNNNLSLAPYIKDGKFLIWDWFEEGFCHWYEDEIDALREKVYAGLSKVDKVPMRAFWNMINEIVIMDEQTTDFQNDVVNAVDFWSPMDYSNTIRFWLLRELEEVLSTLDTIKCDVEVINPTGEVHSNYTHVVDDEFSSILKEFRTAWGSEHNKLINSLWDNYVCEMDKAEGDSLLRRYMD